MPERFSKRRKQAPRYPCHDKIEVLFPKLVMITLRFKIDSVELLERITALVYNSLPFLVSSTLKLSVVGNCSHVG